MSKSLSIFDIFIEFSFEKISVKQKLRKAPDDKTRSEALFSKNCLIHGRNFPQHDPNFGKTEFSSVFLLFQAVSDFWVTSLHKMV